MLSQPPLWLILLAFVCALGPLVFFHELGHYVVARLFSVPAEIFSIGFGHEIVGWTDRQGTRWKVGWLPLGGYVRFVGDMNAASVPGDGSDIPPELRDRAFQFRPVWQRFLIVLAGPAANFLLAVLIFAAFFTFVGAPMSNVVGSVVKDTPAARAGIEPGDRILSVGGRPTPTFEDLSNVTSVRPDQSVTVVVQRGQFVRELRVTLATNVLKDAYGDEYARGFFGIGPSDRVLQPMPITRAVPEAVGQTARLTGAIVDGLGQIVRGRVSPEQLGGPVKIAKVAGEAAALGPLVFVQLLALLSINLGFINLLPVPLLDGGHLLLYLVEGVRRKAPSATTLEWAFRGGLALILALFLFVTVNDLGAHGLLKGLQRLIG